MKLKIVTSWFLTFVLVLNVSGVQPAFALRVQAGLESTTEAELAKILEGHSGPAAGLEEWQANVDRLIKIAALVITVMQSTADDREKAIKQGEKDVVNALAEAFRLLFETRFVQNVGELEAEEFRNAWLDLVYILTGQKSSDPQQAIRWLREKQSDADWKADVLLKLLVTNGIVKRFKKSPEPTSLNAFLFMADIEYLRATVRGILSDALRDSLAQFSEPLVPEVVSRVVEVIQYPHSLAAGMEEDRVGDVVERLASAAQGHPGVLVVTQGGLEEYPGLIRLARNREFAGRMILFGAALKAAQLAQMQEFGVRVIEERDFEDLVLALLSMKEADRVAVLEEAGLLAQALGKVLPPSMRVIHLAIGARIQAILSAFLPEEELDQFDPEALAVLARLAAA